MEFAYNGKHEYDDTDSTREFKQKLREWYSRPKHKPRQIKQYIVPIILAFVIILLIIKLENNGSLERFSAKVNDTKENISKEIRMKTAEAKEAIQTKIEEYKEDLEKREKDECQEAMAKVNDLRRKERIGKIQWNDDVYKIALERAKDMYERGYFSHDTPDGKDIGDYIKNIGVSENIGKGYYSCSDAVDGWIESPGHHRNLLFGNFGAIAKSHDIYVYVSTLP